MEEEMEHRCFVCGLERCVCAYALELVRGKAQCCIQSPRVRADAAHTWLSIVHTRTFCLKSKQSGVVNGGVRVT